MQGDSATHLASDLPEFSEIPSPARGTARDTGALSTRLAAALWGRGAIAPIAPKFVGVDIMFTIDAGVARRVAACAAMGVAGAPAAEANWFAAISGPTQYWAKFTKMPDFDQVRSGLPGDGSMYCVPTSAVNLLAYIAHHGYPDIFPGDHSQPFWHTQSAYNESTNALAVMGTLMNTSAVDGTYGGPAEFGLNLVLDHRFIVVHRWLNGGETPRFDDIASHLRAKHPVMACVGWYSDDGTVLSRNGGHCFAVVKVQRSGDAREITIHDPANEQSNLFTQSPALQQTYDIEPRFRFVNGGPRVIDKMVGYGSGYIDSYFAIVPLTGLATSVDFTTLLLLNPLTFTFDDTPDVVQIPAPGIITALAPSPTDPSSIVTTAPIPGGPGSTIWKFDPETREFESLLEVDDAQAAVFDRFGRLYVLDGRTIRCFAFVEGRLTEEASVVPTEPVKGMTYSDATDELVVIADTMVRRFGPGLEELLPAVQIPEEVVLEGETFIASHMSARGFFVTSEGSPAVYHLVPFEPARAEEFEVSIIAAGEVDIPNGLTIADGPCIAFSDSTGKVQVWCFDAAKGVWELQPDHPLAGREAGVGVQMRRSRTNFDPELHATPAYNNILPEETAAGTPPCAADLNDDNAVDGADLGRLLGAWGDPTAVEADLNGDGTVDGADLGSLLGAWGPCPI